MKRVALGLTFALALGWTAGARAQGELPEASPESHQYRHDDRRGQPWGRCGGPIRSSHNRHVIWSDERDGLPFRGIGAPEQGSRLELEVASGTLPINDTSAPVGATLRVGVHTTAARLARKLCLVVHLSLPFPLGSMDQAHYNTGNFTLGVSLLYRSSFDTFRFELGATGASPSAGARLPSALALQTGHHAALLTGVDEQLQWLPVLELGAVGWVRLFLHSPPKEWGFWTDLRLILGYGQISTTVASTGGLLGGLRLALGMDHRYSRPRRWGVRWGGEARLSFGSLWPTDMAFPLQVSGLTAVAFPGRLRTELHFRAGAVAPSPLLQSDIWHFQTSVMFVLYTEGAIAGYSTDQD